MSKILTLETPVEEESIIKEAFKDTLLNALYGLEGLEELNINGYVTPDSISADGLFTMLMEDLENVRDRELTKGVVTDVVREPTRVGLEWERRVIELVVEVLNSNRDKILNLYNLSDSYRKIYFEENITNPKLLVLMFK